MLQGLLADRFMLRAHMEKRESPAYLLVPARADGKLGSQLRPGTVNCSDHRGDAPPPDSVAPPAPPVECGFRIATMNRLLCATAFGFAACAVMLSAQTSPKPEFDVASIKPNIAAQRGGASNTFLSGGRYVGTIVSLRRLIGVAYQPLLSQQIVGGPAWINTELYDVTAKAEGNPTADTLRLMLQSLLADRFKLRTHIEKRDSPVFALGLARSDGKLGSQLTPGTVDCSAHRGDAPPPDATPPPPAMPECGFRVSVSVPQPQPDGTRPPSHFAMIAKGVTMEQLTKELSTIGPVGRIVLDRTGLAGGFDVNLTFETDSIFTSIREQLGLKLDSTTAPVDFLVIDAAEHPSQN
jgi:uncharacterized protein (TIGR03435 family)